MKKLLIGAAIGAGAAAVYAAYKMKNNGQLDKIGNDLHRLANKARKNIKDTIDMGKNHAEYIKDEVEYEFVNDKEIK